MKSENEEIGTMRNIFRTKHIKEEVLLKSLDWWKKYKEGYYATLLAKEDFKPVFYSPEGRWMIESVIENCDFCSSIEK